MRGRIYQRGNCFQLAFECLSKLNDQGIQGEIFLIQALVFSVPWKRYIHHAWVEFGDIVFDDSMGRITRKENYYEIAKPKRLHRYPLQEACRAIGGIGHYGPWTKKDWTTLKIKEQRQKNCEMKVGA